MIERDILQGKLDTLKRAIKINIFVSECLNQADEPEVEMNPLWKQALIFTQDLAKRTVFSSYADLMSYGNKKYQKLALVMVTRQRVYFLNDVLHAELLPGERLKQDTDRFVSDIQAYFYADQYKRTH